MTSVSSEDMPPTKDFIQVLDLFYAMGKRQPGRPFQFILADVQEQVYCNTGKWDDRDMEEVYNDEYIDALRDLIEEHTIA